MIIAVLVVLGLMLGSFVNALVWRIHEQETKKKTDKKLSILNGRSMCPNCQHELAIRDLLPVLSWLRLGGKCRYCHKPISKQYPLVELLTSIVFVFSYIWWPQVLTGAQSVLFCLWLAILTGLIALLVYDLKWFLLPNRIVYPLSVVAAAFALGNIILADNPTVALIDTLLAVLVGGGIFYVLFQVSGGKWIGGGDVKLGWMLGLVMGTPARSVLMIFLASLLGSIVSLPLLFNHKLKRSSMIPFGPFLILAAILVQLFGADILDWYRQTFIYL
jgi:prepilin signal peptidase PulO-like enzyme (type II secretory pathway)